MNIEKHLREIIKSNGSCEGLDCDDCPLSPPKDASHYCVPVTKSNFVYDETVKNVQRLLNEIRKDKF